MVSLAKTEKVSR